MLGLELAGEPRFKSAVCTDLGGKAAGGWLGRDIRAAVWTAVSGYLVRIYAIK
jgi:hypothetical protein